MRAELKFIDFNGNIATKEDAQLLMCNPEYYLPLCLAIGEKDIDGSDYFYVDVYSLEYIEKKKVFLGSKSIVCSLDDFDDLENKIREIISSIEGDFWEDILKILRELFRWEYEDHKFLEIP